MEQPQSHPFTRAKVVIFDIDDTLYNLTNDMSMEAGVAFCGAVRSQLGAACAFTDQEIIKKGMNSHREHGDAYRDRKSCSGADPRVVHENMHNMWEATSIKKNDLLRSMLMQMKANGVQLYAYSDAHRERSRRVLTQLGISDMFPPDHLVTRDQLASFETKRHGTEGFEKIKALSGAEYDEMVFIDDSRENLAKAKSLGITTVLNDQRHESKELVEPDYSYNSVLAFMRAFMQSRVSQLLLGVATAPQAAASRT